MKVSPSVGEVKVIPFQVFFKFYFYLHIHSLHTYLTTVKDLEDISILAFVLSVFIFCFFTTPKTQQAAVFLRTAMAKMAFR